MIPLLIVRADPADRELLSRIARHLERGGLLGYPTETVYGLGAAATVDGTDALRKLKGRRDDKPFLVLLPDGDKDTGIRGGKDLAGASGVWDAGLQWTAPARELASAFWPGPLTLVLSDSEGRYPPGVRSTSGGVAVRVSSNPFVAALLEVWDAPLLSTSANRPGGAPARSAREVERAVQGRPGLDRFWIADGGPLPASDPSTVIDCTDPRPRLLRVGAVSAEEVAKVLSHLHG